MTEPLLIPSWLEQYPAAHLDTVDLEVVNEPAPLSFHPAQIRAKALACTQILSQASSHQAQIVRRLEWSTNRYRQLFFI